MATRRLAVIGSRDLESARREGRPGPPASGDATGTADSVDPDELKVKISSFARPTAIALDDTAVGKLEERAAA
jgi:hypothetical protein